VGSSRIKQNLNRGVIDRECTRKHRSSLGDVTHGGEIHLSLVDLHHWPLSWIGRLGPCTLILWVGLALLGLGAITHIVPQLATIVTTAITSVTWGCVRIGSLLLSAAELEVP
jgi:hypothetical protein